MKSFFYLLLNISSRSFKTFCVQGRKNNFNSTSLCNSFSDNIEVAHLSTIKKEDVLQFYKELLCHDAPKRHKLCVHISSMAPSKPDESDNNVNATGEGLATAPPSCDVSTFSEQHAKVDH